MIIHKPQLFTDKSVGKIVKGLTFSVCLQKSKYFTFYKIFETIYGVFNINDI